MSSLGDHTNKKNETQESDDADEEAQVVERSSSSSGLRMSQSHSVTEQDENTSRLIMSVYDIVAHPKDGAKASDITEYLRKKYGDLWQLSTLTGKAEEALNRKTVLGFMEKRGEQYVTKLAREACYLTGKKKRCCCRKKPRRCCRRRRCRRRRCCRRRCCRRRKSCGACGNL